MSKDLGMAEGRTAGDLFDLLKPMHDLTVDALTACKKAMEYPFSEAVHAFNKDAHVYDPLHDDLKDMVAKWGTDVDDAYDILRRFAIDFDNMILNYCCDVQEYPELRDEPIWCRGGGHFDEP